MLKTTEIGSIKITVERSKVRHRLVADAIWGQLEKQPAASPTDNYYRKWFGRVVAQTVSLEGLEFTMPKVGEADEAYAAFMELDGEIGEKWIAVVQAVDEAPGDPDFIPPEQLPSEKAADPKSNPPETDGGEN